MPTRFSYLVRLFLTLVLLVLFSMISPGRISPGSETQERQVQSSPRLPFIESLEPLLDVIMAPPPKNTPRRSSPTPPSPMVTPSPLTTSQLVNAVHSWVSYYSDNAAELLRHFDLIVLDAEAGAGNYSKAEISQLKVGGKLVVSYLNVGAIETFRSYWEEGQTYKLDDYSGWPDEFWVDASKLGWQDLVMETAGKLLAQGVNGFYLDNLDVAEQYESRPEIRRGVISLIERLRKKYPSAFIVAQNGLFLRGDQGSDGQYVYTYLDGWAQEEVFTTYEDGYSKVGGATTKEYTLILQELQGKGLATFCLDYADSEGLRNYARAEAKKIGCLSYVGTKELDQVIIQ